MCSHSLRYECLRQCGTVTYPDDADHLQTLTSMSPSTTTGHTQGTMNPEDFVSSDELGSRGYEQELQPT